MCDNAYSDKYAHVHDPTPCNSVNSLALVRHICNGEIEGTRGLRRNNLQYCFQIFIYMQLRVYDFSFLKS